MLTGYTNFFKQKWNDIYSIEPSVENLNSLLKNAIQIQKFQNLFDKSTMTFTNVLAIYWVPSEKLIIKIDSYTKSAITFYTEKDMRSGKNS